VAQTRALLQRARQAAQLLAPIQTDRKNAFLARTAELLIERQALIVAENARDLEEAARSGRPAAFLDRLRLDVPAVAKAVREIAGLPDPVGVITAGSRRPNGLQIRRQRIPLGVIGIVYESRPNVTIDAAALCVKAGNCVVLRGGSEAAASNAVLCDLLRDALRDTGLPEDAVLQPPSYDRAATDGLDLVIPRGGPALIDAVTRAARVPVIQHYQGVCHLFVHAAVDLDLAERVIVNAKTQRPGVCNAVEGILIDAAIADRAVPQLVRALAQNHVEIRGCPRTLALAPGLVVAATDDDLGHEYLDLVCMMRVVEGLPGAVEHIARYGSRHTEGILTQDLAAADEFTARVDASCVVINASTRFNDGGCLGLGAEIGISTSKLHAYGPMGLEHLTAERWVVVGQGHVRT
jgi:glutamate-5-semialdehyde dehydrogenase